MKSGNRLYIAIDLKSFYASVECVERGLDPLAANLVVADESRTDKTICLINVPTRAGIDGGAHVGMTFSGIWQIYRDSSWACYI